MLSLTTHLHFHGDKHTKRRACGGREAALTNREKEGSSFTLLLTLSIQQQDAGWDRGGGGGNRPMGLPLQTFPATPGASSGAPPRVDGRCSYVAHSWQRRRLH